MSQLIFVATSFLDVSQFVKMLWFMRLYYEILIVVLSLFFSAVTSAFQLFTCKLCLQFSGLRMRNVTWNRFPIKNLLIDSLLKPILESTYLNRDMCKFESSQKDENRWQSTDCSKAYRNISVFKCFNVSVAFWPAIASVLTFLHMWNKIFLNHGQGFLLNKPTKLVNITQLHQYSYGVWIIAWGSMCNANI